MWNTHVALLCDVLNQGGLSHCETKYLDLFVPSITVTYQNQEGFLGSVCPARADDTTSTAKPLAMALQSKGHVSLSNE